MALGAYNRQTFNRAGTTAPVYTTTYSMFGTITASAQAGAVISPQYHFYGEIDAQADLLYGYVQEYTMEAAFEAEVTPSVLISAQYDMSGEITAFANPLIQEYYDMSGEISAKTELYALVIPEYTMTGSIVANIDSEQEREYIMQFVDLDIPAGSSLVIDSEFYTVTLDGENVIDRYSGDWIYFTRLLRSLEVSSGISGDLDVSILYQERYL